MAAVNFFTFDAFWTEFAKGKTGTMFDLTADTLSIYLSNAAPNRATHAVKADLAEITAKNGYTGMIDCTITSRAISSNAYRIVANDIELTGSTVTDGSGFGPFHYAILLSKTSNATDANRRLIGYWAYPSTITVPNLGIFKLDFSATDGMLRLRSAA